MLAAFDSEVGDVPSFNMRQPGDTNHPRTLTSLQTAKRNGADNPGL